MSTHVVGVVHASQGVANGVVAHAALARQQAREHIPSVPRERANFRPDRQGLRCERDEVRPAIHLAVHRPLHLVGWDRPERRIRIDLGPLIDLTEKLTEPEAA